MLNFFLIPRSGGIPPNGRNSVFLRVDHWNDYSFVTMFHVSAYDENGAYNELGSVKIGFLGQTESVSTYSTIPAQFDALPEQYFSVGTDVDYYLSLSRNFSRPFREHYLKAIRDLADEPQRIQSVSDESVFQISLLRSLNITTIQNQFVRVLGGGIPLTNFAFRFIQDAAPTRAGYKLEFDIKADSTPSTNIHAIIGRNGAGKTTILNNMPCAS